MDAGTFGASQRGQKKRRGCNRGDRAKTFQETISFSEHMVQNPIINVQGNNASARWYFFGMFKFYRNNTRRWQAARYHEKYERTSGEWKIKHLKVEPPTMSAKYETGW